MVPQGVIAYLKLSLTHAALAPATNQMGGRNAAGSAPCFSMRCLVPEAIPPSERTRVVRESHRGAYDHETIYKILDEGYVCHVGFAVDSQPYVIPTLFPPIAYAIYFHGSPSTPILPHSRTALPVSV